MIGVVADDTTGANDIGLMFAQHGFVTQIALWGQQLFFAPDADIIVIDTDSRLDPPPVAYQKVFDATRRLLDRGCTRLYKKTCSVFRGNVGAEFDAMLDASGEQFMVVSVAYPKNGRQTRHGIHFVQGCRLEDSAFAQDPVHPTRESNLITLLEQQSKRGAGVVPLETVRAGAGALRAALEAQRDRHAYGVVDALTQPDLATLAEAAQAFPLFGGSSALAEELPRHWPRPPARNLLAGVACHDSHGVLIASGSLTPQTKAQTAALRAAGVPALTLDSRLLLDTHARRREIARVVEAALPDLRAGRDVLLAASQDEAVVAETKLLAAQHRLDHTGASKVVSWALAEAVTAVVDATGLKRLVVAGGDTAGALCRQLGIRGNYVLQEIATGVPSCLALGRPMLLVLKSGSFGDSDFLLQAAEHLKAFAQTETLRP